MQNRLNLATKPFTNHALPWVVVVVLMFSCLIAMVFITRATANANAKAQVVQVDINNLNKQEQDLLKKAEEVKQSFTPEQLTSLKSAHELVNRKRFSWSRLFADLETVMPGEVRVSRIAVRQVRNENGRTIADLELSVVSKTYNIVTDMMSVMGQQGTFHAELVNQNLQKGKGEGGSEYELRVEYIPRAGYTTTPTQPARAAIDPAVIPATGGLR